MNMAKMMVIMMTMKMTMVMKATLHKDNNLKSYMAALQCPVCILFVTEVLLVAVMIESFLANKPHLVEN